MANYNAPGQVVIAGTADAVAVAGTIAKIRRAPWASRFRGCAGRRRSRQEPSTARAE